MWQILDLNLILIKPIAQGELNILEIGDEDISTEVE